MKRQSFPFWALVSVLLTPLAPLLGSAGIVIAETLVDKPHGVITNYFPWVARTGVLVMLAALGAGVAAAVVSLIRRERPRALAMLSAATNVILIVTFFHAQYYKLGYDQDRGALPPAGYLAIAEGLTAASAGQEMQTDVRMFSPPEMPARCEQAAGVARLTAVEQVQLRVEEPFPLKTLNVAAFDASGAFVASVPVAIEVEQVTPPVLYFWPSRLQQGPTAHSAGFFLFKVRTVCAGQNVEVTIRAHAVHRR